MCCAVLLESFGGPLVSAVRVSSRNNVANERIVVRVPRRTLHSAALSEAARAFSYPALSPRAARVSHGKIARGSQAARVAARCEDSLGQLVKR
jgi:hypothetical protein